MKMHELFVKKVTRDIPPVVYFHEQSAEKLADEVGEYIVTGGYSPTDPRKQRMQEGIHEELVRLLRNIRTELDKKGGPELPACWISGYFGSGKSSFAKLLGLALDGRRLPDGTSLADALIARDDSQMAPELRKTWEALIAGLKPVAVAFDIGAVARDAEHVHSAIARQIQLRLQYCSTSNLVATFELKLEIDRQYDAFLEAASRVLKRPWSELKDTELADTHFSHAMHAMDPERYREPTSWLDSQAFAQSTQGTAVIDAVRSIEKMIEKRAPGRTLFIVVDEVSQYVHDSEDRMLKLQSFVAEVGARLRGGVWLLATGQQKLDDAAGIALVKMKDRFPERLRVHLGTANTRDVVHRRLLKKAPGHEHVLRTKFRANRPMLALYGYGCEDITEEDFVEVYPMVPKQIELLMRITTAIRSRSARAQGDAHAIRGLLQLLGELFRAQQLADKEVGDLVTLDAIFEVVHTALDPDAQVSLTRVLDHCASTSDPIAARAVKAVALLELIQEETPTTAELVAQCLYARLGQGDERSQVTEALQRLRDVPLLVYSEKQGYKLQSLAAQEWERDRNEQNVTQEHISVAVRGAIERLMADVDRPRLHNRPFPWVAFFSDGRQTNDVRVKHAPQDAVVTADFRWVTADEQEPEEWIRRSKEELLRERFVWVVGSTTRVEQAARRLLKSRRMIELHAPKRESLSEPRKRLLRDEETAREELEKQLRQSIEEAFVAGALYFSGRPYAARDEGTTFEGALHAFAEKRLKELYPQYVDLSISPGELGQLLDPKPLSGPSQKFFEKGLGILSLDAGRIQLSCEGLVPRRIFEAIKKAGGLSGSALLGAMGRPPFGYAEDVVQACAAGLLRAGKIRIELDGGTVVTSVRDPGVQNLFSKDRDLRRATFFPTLEEALTQKDRNRICTVLEGYLGVTLDRENDAIADAVFSRFGEQRERLRRLEARFTQVPGQQEFPDALERFGRALESCRASRQVEPTVKAVKQHLDALRDGFETLGRMESDLTEDAVMALKLASLTLTEQASQLDAAGALADVAKDAEQIRAHLGADRPWIDAPALHPHVEHIVAHYQVTRKALLGRQEQEAEATREEIKRRQGFELLNADQTHRVLRPITEALWDTVPTAIAPRLDQLRDGFPTRLARAQEEANDRFDQERSKREERPVVKVDLRLRGRELESPAQIEALVRELQERLLPLIEKKHRVRLL